MDPNEPAKRRASSEDVLGTAPERIDVPEKWRKQYDRLVRLRETLRRKKGDLVKDVRTEESKFSLHMADAATDEYDTDWALSMISAEQDALNEIEQAMSRVLKGEYGVCELTGKPIDPERLDAIPWTRFSKEAEEKLEREGQMQRPGLGQTERVSRTSTNRSVGKQGMHSPES